MKYAWIDEYLKGKPGDLLKDLLDKAYEIVLGSLSKKKHKEILDGAVQGELISCCGSDCGTCYCYGKMCAGCNAVCGKVFHAPEGKECPIYYCCRITNAFKSCGECEYLPCDLILGTRDPSLSEEDFMKTVEDRVHRLKGEY